MKVTPTQIKDAKANGFLHNRNTDNFSARIITENGVLNHKQLKNLSEAAEKFGNGNITFTTRLTVELPGVSFENIEPFTEYIQKGGMVTGGTGAKVRPVACCKGTTCIFGLYDTQQLAKDIHNKFFEGYKDIQLPHKFKISVGGCPNNCMKPNLNDFGIVGQKITSVNKEICKSCKTCNVILKCPMNAAIKTDLNVSINKDICNNCGRCITNCPFNAIDNNDTFYKVYLGGRWGKKIRIGTQLSKLVTHDEVFEILEKSILLFKSRGIKGERFGETIDRIGIDETEKLLFSNELIENRQEIVSSEIKVKF